MVSEARTLLLRRLSRAISTPSFTDAPFIAPLLFGPQGDDRMYVRSVEVPLPERQENGVILAPTTATIRIQE